MSRLPRKLKKKRKKLIVEFNKCLEDPKYFYSKYCLINLKRPAPLTDRQKELLHQVRVKPMTMEQVLQEYPLLPEQCFTWNIQGQKKGSH